MFNITSHYSFALAVIFIPVSVFLSIYFYRNSTVTGNRKYILITIKSLAIFLLLVLLIEPSLLSFIKNGNGRTGIVLVDNTRSMNLPGIQGKIKKDEIREILENKLSRNNLCFFTFANNNIIAIKPSQFDSLKYDGFVTNPSSALDEIKKSLPEESIDPVIIISDGIFNSGGNPLYKAKLFGSHFITIGIGDTVQKKDVVIDKVFFNEKALTGTVNPVKVVVSSYGIPPGSIGISLLREGSVINTKSISITNTPQTSEVSFEVTETNPGIVRYTVTAEQVPGEVTYNNNRTSFLVEYSDNKVNLLYVSAGPGYDNSFLTDILKRVKNYRTTFKTAKSPNEFYEGSIDYKNTGDISAVILQGFPSSIINTEVLGALSSAVREKNIPLIFFTDKNTDYKKLDLFDEFIPFSISRASGEESLFSLRAVTGTNPELNDILTNLESAPQIFKNVSGIQQKPGSEVLMTDRASGDPILITRNTGKIRSAAFLGYGLWRWRLNERKDFEVPAEKFLMSLVSSTISKEKKTKLYVYPSKSIFDYTENIRLFAEVYDDNYSPIKNAEVTGKITSDGKTIRDNVQFNLNENKYMAELPPLPPGDYTIDAEAKVNNSFYAKDASRFLSDTVNTEYLITKSNFENLRSISGNTGGNFFTSSANPGEISEYISSIENLSPRENITTIVKYSNFWENWYIMLLILGLFSVEWFLRKRFNLP